MFNKISKDDRGFSLIELIVCILMLGMVTGIIVIFVASSTNSYNLIYDEVNMQTEADVAMTYINELAVEAKDYTVTGSYSHGGAICNALCMEAPDPEGVSEPYCYYIIWHQSDDNKLRFCKFTKDSANLKLLEGHSSINGVSDIDIDASITAAGAYGNIQNFLAAYVTEFTAVPPADTTFPVLQVSIKLEYGGSSYVSTKNIASRNLAS